MFLFFTILVGWMAKGLIGRSVIRRGENLVDRMPVVRSVYGAIKQVAELGAGPGGREGVDHGRTVRGEGGVSKEKGGGESEHADEVYGRLSGKPLGGLRRRKHSDGLSV